MARAYVNTIESGRTPSPSDLIFNESNVVESPVDLDELLSLQKETLSAGVKKLTVIVCTCPMA
jgi:hypothetical protein